MDEPLLVLVHSPLTGPRAWEPAAAVLRSLGHRVAVPDFTAALEEGGPHHAAVAAAVAAQSADAAASVLVAHSGAGALLPAIAEAVPRTVGAVFVDALLPHPGRSWMDTAPTALREHLASIAEGGRLPKWTDWFPPDVIAGLLPDQAERERFTASVPRVPLSYFAETAPDPEAWPPPWCAYVRLSEAYDKEAAEAERSGWPVHRVDGDHLSLMTRPEAVAAVIAGLLERHR
ncbi:hypothetical protein LO763_06715 [Glycomyces sp. A-F 0318]|uniref:alpha/beta fold hydrolase n=1 Tax=Glycomyces amatae TaxID=2881355 RepID=UPI001E41BE90|nr:alpha/beta fold hydrolase [Glycomyces amatae]MCD0443317.1 hypothetical protein [Glycomyces amatae]